MLSTCACRLILRLYAVNIGRFRAVRRRVGVWKPARLPLQRVQMPPWRGALIGAAGPGPRPSHYAVRVCMYSVGLFVPQLHALPRSDHGACSCADFAIPSAANAGRSAAPFVTLCVAQHGTTALRHSHSSTAALAPPQRHWLSRPRQHARSRSSARSHRLRTPRLFLCCSACAVRRAALAAVCKCARVCGG
jgi:hypothetical protein